MIDTTARFVRFAVKNLIHSMQEQRVVPMNAGKNQVELRLGNGTGDIQPNLPKSKERGGLKTAGLTVAS